MLIIYINSFCATISCEIRACGYPMLRVRARNTEVPLPRPPFSPCGDNTRLCHVLCTHILFPNCTKSKLIEPIVETIHLEIELNELHRVGVVNNLRSHALSLHYFAKTICTSFICYTYTVNDFIKPHVAYI